MQQLKNRMAVQGSDKLKLCGGGGGDGRFTIRRHTSSSAKSTWHSGVKKPDSYDDCNYDDDVPLAVRLTQMSNLGTPSSNFAVPVKKRTTTTMPLVVKRPFDDNSSLLNKSVKKSKVALYDHQDKDKDCTPLSRKNKIRVDGSAADKSFSSLKKELESVEKSFEECKRKKQEEEKKLESIQRDIEECKRKRLDEEKKLESILRDIEDCKKELEEKETNLRQVMDNIDKVRERKEECTAELEAKKRELDTMNKQVDEQAERLKTENKALLKIMQINKIYQRAQMKKEFESTKKQLEELAKELESEKKQYEDQVKELESEKEQFEGKLKKLQSKEKLLEDQVKEFKSREDEFEGRVKELESNEEELKAQMQKLRSKENLLEDQAKKFRLMEVEFEGWIKDLDSKEQQLEIREKEVESEKKQFEGRIKKFDSNKEQLEMREKEVESEKKQLEGRAKEFESNEEELKAQTKKLRSKEKRLKKEKKKFRSMEVEFEGRIKEFDSKEKQLQIREKEVESETKQLDGRIKKFDSKEERLEIREKEVESEKKQLEGRKKEFESEEKQLKIQVKELESEKKQFEWKFKELLSKEEEFKARMQKLKSFVSQMEDFKSEGKHFDEGQGKELESKDEKLKVHVKEAKSKEKQLEFDGHMKDLESKPNKFSLVELFDEEAELVTSDSGNQSSPTSEENDEFELADSDTPVNLQGASDPSKVVLEIIQHPTIGKCTMGDNDVIIGDNHIRLLEQLMGISPHIEPDVRKGALKLALELKANAEENNENSVVVLGFLLLLSIYGLVPDFDEDDVLKYFGLVSQHNIAIELFRAMGFADKVSDFIAGLIKRQQYVEAVRFSCEFNFGDNNQRVDLLRQHVQNAKLISESSCNKTNSIEIKDKARDQEIASVETVLQCLSDNNLQFEDLHKEIDDRILELRSQKGK